MIKTILVDDDFLVLQALETILSVQDHIEVVGTGSDGKDAVELYITHKPDLVLMDIRMEPTTGIEAAETILKDFPDWFSLDEAINIAMEKEWQGLEPEWIAKYKQSKANNNYGKQAEQKDTSQLKVDDDFIEQMKERYGIND